MDNGTFTYLFESALHERERIFKLSSAVLNADGSLVVTFIVNADDYDKYLDPALKAKAEDAVKAIVPDDYKVFIVYKKSVNEASYINRLVMEYLYNEAPLMFPKIKENPVVIEIDFNTVTVKLTLPQLVYAYLLNNGYEKKLTDYLDARLMGEVVVELFSDGGAMDVPSDFVRKKTEISLEGIKVVTAETKENIIGSVSRLPRYISDVLKSESDQQTVCGRVEALQRKKSQKTGIEFFVFRLNDTSSVIDVKFFPKDGKKAELFASKVTEGVEIAVEGPVRQDKYSNSFAITLYRASLCTIDYSSISTKVYYKGENEKYIKIEPQPYIEDEQANMFETTDEALPEILKGDKVVFDLETTGLSPTDCKIIEIGAVKMTDGVIKEYFVTLINPQVKIPPDASAKNNIYDKDVAGAPTFEEVVGDFYKFTRGAALIAHNASFDISFLSYHAKKCLYHFDNEVIDTLQMARELVTASHYNLESLAKDFNISLVNAHRALNDCLATAKLFKKLSYIHQKRKK